MRAQVIPYAKQDISQEDIDAVVEVLQSDWITQGPKVPEFEQRLCAYTGAKYGFCVNSATSALHLACLALGLGKGDWLWTSPITFVASANCALYCQAKIDFVDIDSKTRNLCPLALEEKLKKAKALNRLPKILVLVHLAGLPCELERIYRLASEYDIEIIEDASHAIGATYQGKPIGCGDYSTITVFSFHPAKIITSAEGGAVLTNNKVLADKLALLRCHGVTRDISAMTNASHGDWYYQQLSLGFNYRMTDIQAALGLSQLKRIKSFLEKRRLLAHRYQLQLQDLPLILPLSSSTSRSSHHLYLIELELSKISSSHQDVFNQLRHKGIGVNLHYIPVHLQPFYQDLGFKKGDFPKAERYYHRALSLPLYASLTETEQDKVIAVLRNSL